MTVTSLRTSGGATSGRADTRLQIVDVPGPLDLSPNQYAILGLLSMGMRSGYEIKRASAPLPSCIAPLSSRWVYADLRSLSRQGLIAATDASHGQRRRMFYELTNSGHLAVNRWLTARTPGEAQFRHEGLERLYFSEKISARAQIDILRRLRDHHRDLARAPRYRGISVNPAPTAAPCPGTIAAAVAAFDAELNQFIADWCQRLLATMRSPATSRDECARNDSSLPDIPPMREP